MKGTEGMTVLKPLRQSPTSGDPSGISGTASCALSARFEAVKCARDFTRTTLRGWELAGYFDSVALVVSELVTNALRHGVPAETPADAESPVRLHLMRWTSRLVCAVRDPSAAAPVARVPDFHQTEEDFAAFDTVEPAGIPGDSEFGHPSAPSGESGRGLFLVDSFSDSWGWQPLGTANNGVGGKVVWALFRLGTRP